MNAENPVWRFFRAGGFDQVRLETAAELCALAQLDQKLWVALSCPVKGIEFDPQTLALVDEAWAELAAWAAKREALRRAYEASGQSVEAFADMYGMDLGQVKDALAV